MSFGRVISVFDENESYEINVRIDVKGNRIVLHAVQVIFNLNRLKGCFILARS